MALTLGLVSKTLKVLFLKKLICAQCSLKDDRSISYQVTEQGVHLLGQVTVPEQVMQTLDVDFF